MIFKAPVSTSGSPYLKMMYVMNKLNSYTFETLLKNYMKTHALPHSLSLCLLVMFNNFNII